MFREFVPDFTYHVINLHKYSAEERLPWEELALVMLFNWVQKVEDLDIKHLPPQKERVQKILRKAPRAVQELLVVHHFGLQLNVPEDNIEKVCEECGGKGHRRTVGKHRENGYTGGV